LQGVEARLGGALGMLRCWGRCLLVAGSKSYTHMVIALERYYGPLKNAVDAAGAEVGGVEGGGRRGRTGPWHALVCNVRWTVFTCGRELHSQHPPAATSGLLPSTLPHTQGEAALVDVANRVWRRSPQRATMAVDRLMTLRLVSADAIIK
jgi:hypothetical protein